MPSPPACVQCGKKLKKAYKVKNKSCWCSRECYISWAHEHKETATCRLCRKKYKKRSGHQKYCFICQRVLRITGRAGQQRQWLEDMVEIAKGKKEGPMRVGSRGYERITVDIDDPDDLDECKKVLHRLGFRDLEVRRSSSGKGFHVIAWVKDGVWPGYNYLPKYQLLFTRRLALDDSWRCWLDSLPHRQMNVLFNGKKKRVIKDGEVSEYNHGYD